MRFKDYARNRKKRKEYVQQPGLLMIGVDVSKAKNNAYLWTKAGVICRKLGFPIVIIRGDSSPKFRSLKKQFTFNF